MAWRILWVALLALAALGAEAKRAAPASPVQGLEAHPGVVDVHLDKAGARVVIGVHELDAPLLLVSALPGALGSNDIGLDRAQPGEPRLVEFRRLGKKLLLVQRNTRFVADSSDPDERQSARDAFAEAVLWSGDLLNADAQAGPWLVDFSSFLTGDRHGIGERLKALGQGSYSLDAARSGVLVEASRALPDNAEFEALLTFSGEGEGAFVQQVASDPHAITLRQQISLVRLPEAGFQPRAYHPASGSWSVGGFDFAQPLQHDLDRRWQARFRLQKTVPGPAPSRVLKPIVFYLDRGTPEPVRSALLEGAGWWAAAFEAAGFIDAFRVELAPAGMDMADVRYNTITWTHRATRGWSYGGGIVDPRSGEIIKGYVNLGSQRVRQDLLIAEGLLAAHAAQADPALKQQALDMALARLRQLAAHEVGHALGFAHNFAASRHGNGSVLDYPHPIVALDGARKVALASAYGVGVGEWDRYVVAHGYAEFAPGTEAAGLAALRQGIAGKGYRYVSDADARAPGDAHPDGLLWDIGGDAIDGLRQLFEVRAAALANFAEGALPPGRQRGELERRLVPIYLLHRYQTEAVARLLGGIEYDTGLVDPVRPQSRAVDGTRQQAALQALRQALALDVLAVPESILSALTPPAVEYSRGPEYFATASGPMFDPNTATGAATALVAQFALAPARLNRLAWQHAEDPSTPSVRQVFEAMLAAPWRETGADQALLRRSRNWVLLDAALNLLAGGQLHPTVAADWNTALRGLAREWRGRADNDAIEAARLVERYLDEPETVKLRPLPVIPPGAPI